ncbi:MAG: hypothetical protein ACXV3U_09125 [Halobacteriota archaeon]
MGAIEHLTLRALYGPVETIKNRAHLWRVVPYVIADLVSTEVHLLPFGCCIAQVLMGLSSPPVSEQEHYGVPIVVGILVQLLREPFHIRVAEMRCEERRPVSHVRPVWTIRR